MTSGIVKLWVQVQSCWAGFVKQSNHSGAWRQDQADSCVAGSVGCSLTQWENDVCPKPARMKPVGTGNQTISPWCQQTGQSDSSVMHSVEPLCSALRGVVSVKS